MFADCPALPHDHPPAVGSPLMYSETELRPAEHTVVMTRGAVLWCSLRARTTLAQSAALAARCHRHASTLCAQGAGHLQRSVTLCACCRLAAHGGDAASVTQINVFMGIGLLSCPYAMRLSGWAGLLSLAGATCLFCLSGKLIVAGFNKIPADMPQTYPALGDSPHEHHCMCTEQCGFCA